MYKKYLLVVIGIVSFTLYASEPIRICHDSVIVSDIVFETIENESFFNSYNKNIVACSPGIKNMMTYSEIRTSKSGQVYKKQVSWFIGKENHPFVSALYFAFARHKKITISPDMIWLMICQGTSIHINLNSETYQNYFTKSLHKKRISVRVDELTTDFNDSNWVTAIELISDSLSSFIKPELFNLFNPTFSTTTSGHKAVFQLTLMNAVKEYYEYEVATACGIPEIVIEGKREDWVWMYENVEHLNSLDLQWWTAELKPILKQFINAYDNNIDQSFWCSVLKNKGDSGHPLRVSGWIKNLFPYILNDKKNFVRNEYLGTIAKDFPGHDNWDEYTEYMNNGLKMAAFSIGIQETPFVWEMQKNGQKMMFYSGFLGITYNHSNGMLIPQVGYLIGKKKDDR